MLNLKLSKRIKHAAALVVAVAMLGTAGVSMAATDTGGEFVDKKYAIAGDWTMTQKDGQWVITLGESFDTKNGPDLKVFLSPMSISDVTGATATEGSVLVGKLKSNSGAQEYVLPEGVNPDDFASLLIHCEQFSVLWGGADL